MRALAEIRDCSAWRMSGLRSNSDGWQPRRNLGRRFQLGQGFAAHDVARSLAREQAERVLGLRDVAPRAGYLRGRGIEELLRLAHVEAGGRAAGMAQPHQPEVVLRNVTCTARDFQFQIALAEQEVVAHDIADQRHHHAPPAFFGGQVLRPSRFGKASQAAPQVQFPGERQARLPVASFERSARRQRFERTGSRGARGGEAGLPAQVGKLVRTLDMKLGASLQHALRGDPQVEVLLKRRGQELPQRVVLEQIGPLLVGERGSIRGGAPVLAGNGHGRPLVVGPDGTTG